LAWWSSNVPHAVAVPLQQKRSFTAVMTQSAWHSVISDWYDGGIDHHHSCAAVRAAIAHLPVDFVGPSTAKADLHAYARTVC
jgi:hypothetical protein